jgi:peptide-methionine (R)-S-oxide reductase
MTNNLQEQTQQPAKTAAISTERPDRRAFLFTEASVCGVAALTWRPSFATATSGAVAAPGNITIVEFSDTGKPTGKITVSRVVKSEAEWKQKLTPESFDVTRHEGTERPYSGVSWNNHDHGFYRCICCDNAVFSSETKFESGTGWPSFWQPIAKENIVEIRDMSLGMERTAVSCRECDAHLGHVFDDGPRPTGLRYCLNSAAMRFVKTA